jgi:hypothetical protein
LPNETSPQSGTLTGVWNGSYGYDNILGVPDNAFVAILIEFGGSLSGTIHETLGLADGSVHDANATLRGDHQGDEVDFVKTYGDALSWLASIIYVGTLSADANVIEGHWHIPSEEGPIVGRFVMTRNLRSEKSKARTSVTEKV